MRTTAFFIQLLFLFLLGEAAMAQESNPLSIYKAEMGKEKVRIKEIDKILSMDTIFNPFGETKILTSFSVSGDIKSFSKQSLVRITFIDSNGIEYLVYESNYLLSDSQDFHFQDEFEETGVLDNVMPIFVKIQILKSEVKNLRLSYTENLANKENKIKQLKNDLLKYKKDQTIALLNKRIAKLQMLWVAGETSISKLSYNDKKKMFGETLPNLMGFEYYKGGIFEILSDAQPNVVSSPKRLNVPNRISFEETPTYVSDFDWRNRHGINWNTEVRDQGSNGSCWAYSAVAATEALVNLYYNKKIDLDLSEGNVLACTGTVNGHTNNCNGGNDIFALRFIGNSGVVNQSCFPQDCGIPCYSVCSTPEERIKTSNTNTNTNLIVGENEIKSSIIHNGVLSGSLTFPKNNNWGHAMALTGWGTIDEGDSITISLLDSARLEPITNSLYFGKTYWIFKGSNGTEWGKNGYCNFLPSKDAVTSDSINFCNMGASCPLTPITCLSYTVNDIVVEDKDGDGYYTWGIGGKPSICPEYVEEDGDDSNPNLGPMDSYGILDSITTPITYSDTHIINPNETYFSIRQLYGNLIIDSCGVLNVDGSATVLIMPIYSQITVKNGGILKVKNGAKIRYANIKVENGGTLKIQDNSILEKGSNDSIDIEVGATFDFTYGEIKQL